MAYNPFSYSRPPSNIKAAVPTPSPEVSGFVGEIALLTSTFLTQSHFASTMLDKFQQEISLLGYTMNTHRVTDLNLRELSLPATFQAERVSAIICIEMFDLAYDRMICDLGIPVLFVDGPAKQYGETLPADQLYMDNTTEITRFVHDMLCAGNRLIGFIGDYNHCQSFYERYTAFRCAMLMEGVPVDEKLCIPFNTQKDLVAALAGLESLPNVFICANDFVAWDAMNALSSLGKIVPQDVRILGFDDSPESRMSRPAMSTVHIHTQIMAFSAVHLLITRIREPSLDYRIVHTETDLIYRETTG